MSRILYQSEIIIFWILVQQDEGLNVAGGQMVRKISMVVKLRWKRRSARGPLSLAALGKRVFVQFASWGFSRLNRFSLTLEGRFSVYSIASEKDDMRTGSSIKVCSIFSTVIRCVLHSKH